MQGRSGAGDEDKANGKHLVLT